MEAAEGVEGWGKCFLDHQLAECGCSWATTAPHAAQQILDKEEYTLEELLDEDDIIQECKSLNGRLIAL